MKNNRTGLTANEILQIAFIILKLAHVIEWSWLWVLAPTWIAVLVVLLLQVIIFILS